MEPVYASGGIRRVVDGRAGQPHGAAGCPGRLDELQGGVHPARRCRRRCGSPRSRWPTRPGARPARASYGRRGRLPHRGRAGRRRSAGPGPGAARRSGQWRSTHVPIRPDAPVIRVWAATVPLAILGRDPRRRQRPLDPDGRVVPAQGAGVLGGVAGADQVGEPGVVLERLVAVGDAGGHVQGHVVLRRQLDRDPPAEGGLVGSEVDEDVEQGAVGDPQRLDLGCRSHLVVHPADRSRPPRWRW